MSLLRKLRRPTVLGIILTGVAVSLITARTLRAAETDTIRIEAGQILEIGTDTIAQRPDFSWILTKDRKFQSAQRTRFFQTRLAQAGTYVLDVSVQDPVASQNDYRAFSIVVTEPTGTSPVFPPPPSPDPNAPLKAVLQTDPAPIDGKIYITPEGGMLKIDPSGSIGTITNYVIDIDSSVDSDVDGNPENDRDNQGTYSEKGGTPIYFHMMPKSTARKLTLTVYNTNTNVSDSASLDVVFGFPPVIQAPPVQNPNSPVIMEMHGLTINFKAAFPATQSGSSELLYEWDFGDRTRSLLTAPEHTYLAPGIYTVGLSVRDITTGTVIYSGMDTVQVSTDIVSSSVSSSAEVQSSSSSVVSTSSSATSEGTQKTKNTPSLGTLLKVGGIVFLLLAFAIGLYAIFTWVKRRTTGSLQQTFEKMEQTILKQDPKAAVQTNKAEPMKLKKPPAKSATSEAERKDTITDRETSHGEFNTRERANVVPLADSAPVPNWLKKASTLPTPGSMSSTTTPPATQTAVTTNPPPAITAPPPAPTQQTAAPTPVTAPSPVTPPPIAQPPPPPPPPPAAPKLSAPASATPVASTPAAPAWLKPAQSPSPTTSSTPFTGETAPVPDWLKPVSKQPAAVQKTDTVKTTPPAASVVTTPVAAPAKSETPKQSSPPTPAPQKTAPATPAPQKTTSPEPKPQATKPIAPEAKPPLQTTKTAPVQTKPQAAQVTVVAAAESKTQQQAAKATPPPAATPTAPTPAPAKQVVQKPIPQATSLQKPPAPDTAAGGGEPPIAIIQADSLTNK